jgi:hypothetical protein
VKTIDLADGLAETVEPDSQSAAGLPRDWPDAELSQGTRAGLGWSPSDVGNGLTEAGRTLGRRPTSAGEPARRP